MNLRNDDNEIDMVDLDCCIMYEISISDKKLHNTHFDAYQDKYPDFDKILVGKSSTRNIQRENDCIYRIPYYLFAFWLDLIYYGHRL